ncbi:MAG: EAL domain-containing protein [Lachnospiraceae bacterium]|nr:EAL domain-containing protein [Lachnospiraceae bacterium]
MDILHSHAEKISAILLDIVMPVMDGYAVLSAMKADPFLSKIPVIVSSQKDGDENEVKALSLGAMDFIAKPYKADIIRHRLMNTIEFRETAAMINKVERDELTGLYNKQFFMERVRRELDENPDRQYDLLCAGIERFKLINDTYGPATGDELLKHFAHILTEISGGIGLCGRFVADVFFVLLPHREVYDNEMFQEWTRRVNAFPVDLDIRINCGIFAITNPSRSVTVLCDRAQLAAEKNKGNYSESCCYYDDSIRQKLLEEQFITSSMQTALDQHQFEVYYQPKYDLSEELIAGAEALVRWNHPQKGMLSPGTFIPLFEKNGFITKLDEYVWETVCQDIRSWMDQGYPSVAISVNVSRADIYNPKLMDILLGLIAKYQIAIQYLHLEITESAYTDNPDQIIRTVNRMRELGFIVEMDDFGSGYSSLNMLAEMPVDVLKLDMRFIQMKANQTSGKGILSFVISLAKWLNLAVVAEGVETAEQIAMLRAMDCNYVQGFYYARPMCRKDFETLLRTSRTTEMICRNKTVHQYISTDSADYLEPAEKILLIVDDIEVNRAVLASYFDPGEYQIVEAENGKEAWDYLQKHYRQVEFVLLDLLMPVMDGFQLLDRIRENEHMHNLPVIITSQGDEESEERALDLDADDFISKPYNPAIIQHRVRNVLTRHRLRRIKEADNSTDQEKALAKVEALKSDFDLVRLVDPEHTLVCEEMLAHDCEVNACYSVWGKSARCNHCISLQALRDHARYSKLEYSENGLYFVISQYVPYGDNGAVIEMVTRLNDRYVDNLFDKKLLYLKLDAIHDELDKDPLTGVFNRRFLQEHFDEYLTWAKKSGKNLGIAMVDIDKFKHLNDSCGHLAGDEALKTVATLLQRNVALSQGDFVARFGGDEFLVVCRDIQPEVFARRMEGAAQIIRRAVIDGERALPIRISVGCVNYQEFPDLDAKGLMEEADKRLYLAKHKTGDPESKINGSQMEKNMIK